MSVCTLTGIIVGNSNGSAKVADDESYFGFVFVLPCWSNLFMMLSKFFA